MVWQYSGMVEAWDSSSTDSAFQLRDDLGIIQRTDVTGFIGSWAHAYGVLSVQHGDIKIWKLQMVSAHRLLTNKMRTLVGIIDASQVDPKTRVDYRNRRENGYRISGSSREDTDMHAVIYQHMEQVEVTMSDIKWKRDDENPPSQQWMITLPEMNSVRDPQNFVGWAPAWLVPRDQALVDRLDHCEVLQEGDVLTIELDMTRRTNCTLKYKLTRKGTTKDYAFAFRSIPARVHGWRLAIATHCNECIRLLQ